VGIEKGQEWGRPTALDGAERTFGSDREVSTYIASLDPDAGLDRAILTGGDLWRSLGSPNRAEQSGAELTEVDIDVWQARFQGETKPFVAHAVLRRALWSGHCIAAMNAAFHPTGNLAPRSHPGDGLLDVIFIKLSVSDRLKARKRVRNGTHIPHPGIDMRRMPVLHAEPPQNAKLYLDGVALTTIEDLTIERDPRPLRVVI
jgi:hypothetical protein